MARDRKQKDWFQEGLDCADSGNLEEARRCFQKARLEEPLAWGAWLNEGLANERLGHVDAALDCFEQAVRIKPNLLQATLNLGMLYYNQRKYPKAKYWLKKALDSGTDEPQVFPAYLVSVKESGDQNMFFVSHAGRDKPLVESKLLPLLSNNQVEYFYDTEKIPEDKRIRKYRELGELDWQLEQGLAQCETLLLVWSQATSKSFWVGLELCSAIGMLKNVAVLAIDTTPLPACLGTAIRTGKVRAADFNPQKISSKVVEMLRAPAAFSLLTLGVQTNV